VKSNGMARTSISRTVVKTICEVKIVDKNNDIHEDTIVVFGDYDIDGAQRAVRKKLKNERVLVESIKHESFYGTMTLEDFANNCTKKNRKEW
jgi:hypothetical protein